MEMDSKLAILVENKVRCTPKWDTLCLGWLQRTLLSQGKYSDIDMYLQMGGGSKVGPSVPPHYAWNNRAGGPRPISNVSFLQIQTDISLSQTFISDRKLKFIPRFSCPLLIPFLGDVNPTKHLNVWSDFVRLGLWLVEAIERNIPERKIGMRICEL